MSISWNDGLSRGFYELLLDTIASEGEDATLTRLLAKMDEAALATRRATLCLLTIVPRPAALEWLEARIETPVVEDWGVTAALLGVRWERLAAWMARGRPHSLAALDALVAYAHPGPQASLMQRALQPLLVDPPSLPELRRALSALVASDDSPRVRKTVDMVLERASEILRGGPWLGITGREFWEQAVAEDRAARRLWAESGDELPVSGHDVAASPELGSIWRRRWTAAIRAAERRGGSGSVRIGRTLERARLAAIEDQLGFALPASLADLFTRVAADVDVAWRLPDALRPPVQFNELLWGGCSWDASRLPELERARRGWVENVFPDRDNEYDRVWHDKLAIMDVTNGDLIAIDTSRADRAPVVYLSHDAGDGHGRVLGHSVIDFIDRWTLVGCVGPEEWMMTPFLRADRPYLDAAGDAAHAWRAWYGIDVLAPA